MPYNHKIKGIQAIDKQKHFLPSNPTKNLWAVLKDKVADRQLYNSISLEDGIQEVWTNETSTECHNKNHGGHIRY